MTGKEKQLGIRLANKIREKPQYAEKILIEIKEERKKKWQEKLEVTVELEV